MVPSSTTIRIRIISSKFEDGARAAAATQIEAAAVTRAYQRAFARAGLTHGQLHDLRHACATYPLAQGFTL